VRNLESNYGCESEVAFYLSKDEKIDAEKDIHLDTLKVPQLPGSGAKAIKWIKSLPKDIAPGDYYVLVQLNPGGDLMEVNTENNLMTKKVTIN
jgi:hypothetical protein